jgi:hypothetical protein
MRTRRIMKRQTMMKTVMVVKRKKLSIGFLRTHPASRVGVEFTTLAMLYSL